MQKTGAEGKLQLLRLLPASDLGVGLSQGGTCLMSLNAYGGLDLRPSEG